VAAFLIPVALLIAVKGDRPEVALYVSGVYWFVLVIGLLAVGKILVLLADFGGTLRDIRDRLPPPGGA